MKVEENQDVYKTLGTHFLETERRPELAEGQK